MKRALLVLATGLLALGAVGVVGHAVQADAEPVVSTTSVPAECIETSPGRANSTDARCRDYLYQVHCQFASMASGSIPEAWEGWCKQKLGLEGGGQPEVPRCDAALAGQHSVVGERCRDFLASTECLNGTSSQANMQEFCATVAPGAGPDPRPVRCNAAAAHERSPEGNRCWQKLEREWCSGFESQGNTGVQEENEFCEEVVAGKQPPRVDAACDLALAGRNTDAGHACRDQLYAAECQTLGKRPPAVEEFCQAVSDERKSQREAEEKKKTEAAQPPPQEGGSGPGDGQGPPPSKGSPNSLAELGHEPACDRAGELSPELRRACKLTGSAMHDYPFASYGIDNNVSVDVTKEDFWSGEAPIMSLIQWLLVGLWEALIWLVKVALLLVQWAFAVDPLERAEDSISGSVLAFFDLLGPEWRLTALAVLGVWGFWNGLVRLRFMQTLAGLAASLLLMIGAMWIVYDPVGTIGRVAHYANASSEMALSATSSGELRRPGQGLAQGQHTLFDQLVVGPWCALEFGGQGACNEPTSDPKITRRDLWLSLPANSSAREVLYAATKEGPEAAEDQRETTLTSTFFDALGDGLCMYTAEVSLTCTNEEDVWKSASQENREDHPDRVKRFEEAKASAVKLIKKDPGTVSLQGTEGVFSRAGLLVVIVLGMIGAIAFLLAIGVRLVVAGVIVLLLIMLAPVMLIVAAFGEEGRRRVISWMRMLLGAAIAKLVYSVLLGVVLLVVGILIEVSGEKGDWLGGWLLVSAFFWVALLQMNRVLALLAPDPAQEHSNGLGAGALLYMGHRAVSRAMHGAWGSATYLPRKVAPRAARAVRRERVSAREGTEGAIRGRANSDLEKGALAASLRDKRETGNRAEDVLTRSNAARRRVGRIDRQLERKKLPPGRREQLERERDGMRRHLHKQEPDERWARSQEQHGRGRAEGPSEGELRARRSQRKRDVANWADDAGGWSSESNRRWAGITDTDWKRAQGASKLGNEAPMEHLRKRSEAALRRDRDLFARSDKEAPLSRQTRKEALRDWRGDAKGRRGSKAEFLTREREERRAARRRGRENLRRRRL